MDLKAFVQETLVQIVEGVEGAQRQLASGASNARINPTTLFDTDSSGHGTPAPVEFDVAVTVSEANTSGVGGGLKVVGIQLGGETKDTKTVQAVSRIKFAVDLAQPSSINYVAAPKSTIEMY